jgi:hypothetical protein
MGNPFEVEREEDDRVAVSCPSHYTLYTESEARALLAALAEHLGVELSPAGWRASEYQQRGAVVYKLRNNWMGATGDSRTPPCATAQAAADAVAALASQDGSEG